MSNWFITGVSTGLGRALAIEALAAGHTVTGTVRSADALAGFEALAPGRAIARLLDVTDTAQVQAVIEEAQERPGGIDVLVNNAGLGYTGAIEETSLEDSRALFEVNVWGAMAVIQAALPAMRAKRSGHILNVGSVSGLAPWNGTGLYSATKYALHALTRVLAQELAPLGIQVTYLAPGGMRTEFAAQRLLGAEPSIADYATTAHMAREVLTGHYGSEPSDPVLMARAIVSVAGAADAPELLVLGKDAFKYATGEAETVAGQMDTWRELSFSVAAEPVV